MNQYQKAYIWLLMLACLCAVSQIALGQETDTWDMSPYFLTGEQGVIVKKTEPGTDNTVYLVYISHQGQNAFSTAYLRMGEVCKVGRRTVVDGASSMLWNFSSCSFFEKIDTIHKRMVEVRKI